MQNAEKMQNAVTLQEIEMKAEIIKSVKDDYCEKSGPSTVTHVFLSLDGMCFELGRFYEGPYMAEGT